MDLIANTSKKLSSTIDQHKLPTIFIHRSSPRSCLVESAAPGSCSGPAAPAPGLLRRHICSGPAPSPVGRVSVAAPVGLRVVAPAQVRVVVPAGLRVAAAAGEERRG